jgi:hypothetical protein
MDRLSQVLVPLLISLRGKYRFEELTVTVRADRATSGWHSETNQLLAHQVVDQRAYAHR